LKIPLSVKKTPRPTSRQIKKNKKTVKRASGNSEGASGNSGRD